MNKKTHTYILLSLFSLVDPVYADDIEAYIQPPKKTVYPNMLFVLDRSGSMKWSVPSRMSKLKVAMTSLLSSTEMDDVNLGIMSYTTYSNKSMWMRKESPFQLVKKNRAAMISQVNSLSPYGWTPTVAALDTAVKWYQESYIFDDAPEPSPFGEQPENNWCKANQIILLSDGEPNTNHFSQYPSGGPNCKSDPFQAADGRCSQEIAKWAREQDFKTGTGWDIGKSEGKIQNITTHTIGFDTPKGTKLAKYLQGIADSGGGQYYPASSSDDLLAAFTSIAKNGQTTVDYTFSAPVIPYNPDQTANTGKHIYIPFLKPGVTSFWKGNLKKYNIDGTTITDKSNNAVIDPINYTFNSTIDLWSSIEDKADPLTNGMLAFQNTNITPRSLYSNISPVGNLTHKKNRVTDSNLGLVEAMLDITNADDREDILEWINWEKPTKGFLSGVDLLSNSMGAPIHSQPTVVEYPKTGGDVVFVAGTDGVLKAIDAETGHELWGFIPKEMLKDIKTIALNQPSATPHYGLDGTMTVFNIKKKKYLVIGTRRGGHAYYTLNITDRTTPKFAWSIDKNSTGFSKLGETWSKAMFVKMHLSGKDQDVLVFGAGYDADQDNATTRVADDEGNAIFIVDPKKGDLIKSISNYGADLNIPDMTNSIAGDLLPVDINANGVIDRLYAADVGGRIIRIDIPDDKFSDKTFSGAIIADINAKGSGDYRRFFNTPEVGYFSKNGTQYLSILIGSGHRPKPLSSDVTDRFYMIKDEATWRAPFDDKDKNGKKDTGENFNYHMVKAYARDIAPTLGTGGELYNATENLIQDGTDEQKKTEHELLYGDKKIASSTAKGWFFDFSASGEKSMSKARLYDHAILFTTYSGTRTSSADLCVSNTLTASSRFYAINMTDGSAVKSNFDNDDSSLDRKDRFKKLKIEGIPPSSTLTFDEDGTVNAMVGVEGAFSFKERYHAISWESVNE